MWWTGFMLGLAGSLHCAGMCGPLMLISGNQSALHLLLHHFGRLLAYIALGAMAAGITGSISHPAWQSWVSISLGLLLILMALGQFYPQRLGFAYRPWKLFMGFTFKRKGVSKSFMAGLAHGFLPCGLSFAAAIAAAAMPHFVESMAYMGMFALGTVPALTGFQWLLAPWLKHRKYWTALVMLGTGIWLMVRGYMAVQAPESLDMHCQ